MNRFIKIFAVTLLIITPFQANSSDIRTAGGTGGSGGGDIDSVTATSPLTGGGTSGDITIGVNTSGEWPGNAATVTTNANLTGDVTSGGNATAIAAGVIVNADIKSDAAIAYSKMEASGNAPTWNQNTTGTAAGTTGYQSTFVCDDSDQSAAIRSAIQNTPGTLVLTGGSCEFISVEIESNVHITCTPGTVLRAKDASGPMFKRGSGSGGWKQNWSITDCTVSMEGHHTEFLDVGFEGGDAPEAGTEGNTGWLVDNVKVSFSDGTISDSGTTAFAYFNLSCDPKLTATAAGQSCAFTNNRILGSINSAYSSTANTNANDTGVNFANARTYVGSSGDEIFGPNSLLISQNNITLVEGAAVSFGFKDNITDDSGGGGGATISDNVFSTSLSETPVIYGFNRGALAYSQITGNTFSVATPTGDGWLAEFEGGNNQIVGNTFKPGVTPVLGNSVNFVGNYTATLLSGLPITACKNYGNGRCQHVSFVGNVATGRFVVYNPDDLVVSSNRFLGPDVGVSIIRKFTSSDNLNKIRSISIMSNTFSLDRKISTCAAYCAAIQARCEGDGGTWTSGARGSGTCSGASNSLATVAFSVDSNDDQAAGIISDVQITGNVMGKGQSDVQDRPNFCVDGGNEATEIEYKAFQVLDNILGCKYPGWDGAAAGTTGQTFDGTLEDYAFCGNADKTTEGLSQSCASDKERRVAVSFKIPSGVLGYGTALPCWKVGTCASGSVTSCNSSSDCESSAACNGAPAKTCSIQLNGFPKTSLHDSVYFSPFAAAELSELSGMRVYNYDVPVNVAGNLSGMRCRTDRPQVNVANCAITGYADWGKKFQLRKASSLGGTFSDVANMSCEVTGCDASGTTASQCSATGNVDIVATDVVQIYVTEVGSNVGAVQVSTLGAGVTCEFDWKQS